MTKNTIFFKLVSSTRSHLFYSHLLYSHLFYSIHICFIHIYFIVVNHRKAFILQQTKAIEMNGREDKGNLERIVSQQEKIVLQQDIEHGIKKSINGAKIPPLPDYVDEIKSFLDEKKKNKAKLPFVNQEKILLQLARTLSTGYPYCVLVGESGIGKSLVLNYAIDILTGKVSLDELKKVMPEAVPLFKKIIDQANKFEHRQYLSLPNLKDPMNVRTIAYTDQVNIDNDYGHIETFCSAVSNLLNTYPNDNKDSLHLSFSNSEFKQYVKSKTHEFHHAAYRDLSDNIRNNTKKDSKKQEPVAFIEFELPKKLYSSKSSITADIEIIGIKAWKQIVDKTISKLNKLKLGISKPLIKDEEEILKRIERKYNSLVYDLSRIDVGGLGDKDKEAVLREEFEAYNKKIILPLKEKYAKGVIKNQGGIITELNSAVNTYSPKHKISQTTINDIITRLEDLKSSYISSIKEEKTKEWMESVVTYFKQEKKLLQENLMEMFKYAEEQNEKKEEEERKEKKEDKEISEEKKENKKVAITCFQIPHGIGTYIINQVMQVQQLGYDFSTRKGVTCSKIGQVSYESLFGRFGNEDDGKFGNEDDDDYGESAPHLTIQPPLGSFFKSGILVFQDSFKSFVDVITSDSENAQGMKELFLEYLQTGMLTIESKGVNYHFEAPKIILGCDNEDPFLSIRGFHVKNEAGLRGRIKTIYVSDIEKNTPKARRGSLEVLYDTIDAFVVGTNRKTGSENKMSITAEAANMLLQSTLLRSDMINLEYRNFVKEIEDICAYAISKETDLITQELLKEHVKEGIHPAFFIHIDKEEEYGGYFNLPMNQPGHIHGLGVKGSLPGGLVKVRSYFAPGIKSSERTNHFELIDVKSEMADETAIKGYELAKDFTKKIIAKAIKDGKNLCFDNDWQIKTHFSEHWEGIGGPSASLAIAVSMISALAEEPVYRNRFVTGTIDPMNGEVGAIGGVYFKGLVPLRISELSKKFDEKEEMYFLFPAVNLRSLQSNLIFDPFEFEKNIVAMPIHNFEQAYYLFTCGPRISNDDWVNSEKYGKQKLEDTVSKIKYRFSDSYQKILNVK